MKKIPYYLFILVFASLSCTKYLDFSPPYEGDRLVINGYISPDQGAIVKITHSIKPVGEHYFSDSLYVKDARVFLFENNEFVSELYYSRKGTYQTPLLFQAKAGSRYRLKVQSIMYGEAETGEVFVPQLPEVKNISVTKIGNGKSRDYGLFSFFVSDEQKVPSFYCLSATKGGESEFLFIEKYQGKEGELYFENCETSFRNMLIFSDECGFEETFHRYLVPLQIWKGQPYYEKIEVSIGIVSREFFEYGKSYNDLSGLEYGFSEPPILNSNIKGGYGLFYGKNIVEYELVPSLLKDP